MNTINRRDFVTGSIGLVAAFGCTASALPPAPSSPSRPRTRTILLGTGGGPRIIANGRAKPATAIVIDGEVYVVDCGSGVAQQLVAAGLALTALRGVFITHHHSDHNLDYGNLLYSAWATGLVPPDDPSITEEMWLEGVRRHYRGPVVLGRDLLEV